MIDSKVVVKGATELVRAVESLLSRRYVMVGCVAFLVDISWTDHIIPALQPRIHILLKAIERDKRRAMLLLLSEFQHIMCFCVPWSLTVCYFDSLMQLVVSLILVLKEIEKD